jgi:hypothetical protein
MPVHPNAPPPLDQVGVAEPKKPARQFPDGERYRVVFGVCVKIYSWTRNQRIDGRALPKGTGFKSLLEGLPPQI